MSGPAVGGPRLPRRRGRRWWAWAAAVLALPVVEIVILLALGQAIGGWQTLALLVVISVVGAVVLRREGRSTWLRFRAAAGSGVPPTAASMDGVLVLLGGLLLVLPGLVSDIVGLVCVLPVTRPLARRVLAAAVGRVVTRLPSPPAGWDGRRPVVQGEVLDGEVLDDETPDTR